MIDEHWDPTIADGLDLGMEPDHEFERGDLVQLTDWPDYQFTVESYRPGDDGVTLIDGDVKGIYLPVAALRKVQASIEQVTEALAEVNHRMRDL
jgi:hypothetical protein